MSTGSRSFALAGALAAWIGLAAPAWAEELAAAETRSPRGVSAQLQEAPRPQRVEILLLAQPVLKAASAPRFRALVSTPVRPADAVAAQRSPSSVTASERATALRAERRRERAISSLSDESRAARRSQAKVVAAIRQRGGRVIDRSVLPNSIVARLGSGAISRLSRRRDVQAIDPAPAERPQMDVSVATIGAPAWWTAGFTGGEGPSDVVGASVDVATVNDAVDPTHPAFTGTVDIENSSLEPVSDHGTHLGGVIASNDVSYRGVAFGLDTLIGADDEAFALGIPNGEQPGSANPAEVINLSAGAPALADDANRGEDIIIDLFGVGYAASAGNDGGAETVNNIGKNMLSVAGSNDLDTVDPSDDAILGISSRGPTPGGRKKPDLIAPGASIMSPDLQWNSPAANPDYTPVTGTSFSAPHVAGAMALLAGAGISDPKTQRAILINSAREWSGQTHWQPDVGWGALDLSTALADRGNIAESSVEGGGARFFAASVAPGAKATLAWNMRGLWPNYPSTSPPPTTYTTTNLDLHYYLRSDLSEITPPADPGHGGGPDALDTNDTTEQVRAPAGPASQELIYKVKAASQVDGIAAEPFSLAAETPLDPLTAPEVEPSASSSDAGGSVNCSTDVVISTTVRNQSADLPAGSASPASSAAKVTLELPAGVQLVTGDATQVVSGGTLEAATSEPHSWTVRATGDGLKQLSITGSGVTLGETFSATEPVAFTADCTPPATTVAAGPSGPTNDPTPEFSFSAPGAASFECSLDSAAFAACPSNFRPEPLADGGHSLRVRAIDSAGNVDPTPASRSFVVDTVAPESSIGSGPASPSSDPRPRFGFRANEVGATTECRLDGGSFVACSSPYQFTRLADGEHVFAVRATDRAGNVEPQPATRRFVIDTRVRGAEFSGKGTQRQRGRRPKVRVDVGADEVTAVSVEGKIRIAGKDARIDSQRVVLEVGVPDRLVLTTSRRDGRRVLRTLEDGKPASAELEATFTDAAGNQLKPSLGLRLK